MNEAEIVAKRSEKVQTAARQAKAWLGKDVRVITNEAGDNVFMSSDGLRKFRLDIRNPHGDFPHVHLQEPIMGNRRMLFQEHINIMKLKVFEAEYDGRQFRIEEDLPGVGFYLLVYENGKCVRDDLQDDLETCILVAFEDYQVPKGNWKRMDDRESKM